MKVGTDGRWTGLVYCEKASPYVDYFSSPDGWRFGFDVVYRLIFNTEDRDIIDMFRAAFMGSFRSIQRTLQHSGHWTTNFRKMDEQSSRVNCTPTRFIKIIGIQTHPKIIRFS